MSKRYDVVVVGARCAGSPLAAHLARSGLSVAVVDRAEFPSDAHSTHIFQVDGVGALARLGVLDRVLASGAPWLARVDVRMGPTRMVAEIPTAPSDPGPGLCVRRVVLDQILVEAAQEAGAEVRTNTRVVGLLGRNGRVTGVRVISNGDGGREERLEATLVVGADGAGSTVGRLVGARRYNQVVNQRFGYWGYYQGANWSPPATLVYHRWDNELVIACPADGGRYLAIVLLPTEELGAFRADPEANFASHVNACVPAGAAIAQARRTDRLRAMVTYPAFFRESAGPGWVLVGDAGHVTDPTPGQGISDALRQVERLAPAIGAGLEGPKSLDRVMAGWWKWRDKDAAEMHWFATDLGAAGPLASPVAEAMARLSTRPKAAAAMVDVFNHRMAPSKVLTPPRIMAASGRLLRRGEQPRLTVLRETRDLVVEDRRRRWRNHHPVFTPDQPRREPSRHGPKRNQTTDIKEEQWLP